MRIEDVKRLGLDLFDIGIDTLEAFGAFVNEGFTCLDMSNIAFSSKMRIADYLLGKYKRSEFFLIDTMSSEVDQYIQNFDKLIDKIGYIDCLFTRYPNNRDYEKTILNFVQRVKSKSLATYIGIKYNGETDLLKDILNSVSEIEVVSFKINYMDWFTNKSVKDNYELAKGLGKKIIAYASDSLFELPSKAEDILREYDPYSSPRSWSVKFISSLPEVNLIITNPLTKKELYDDIITINYKSDKMSQEELKCLSKVCDFITSEKSI